MFALLLVIVCVTTLIITTQLRPLFFSFSITTLVSSVIHWSCTVILISVCRCVVHHLPQCQLMIEDLSRRNHSLYSVIDLPFDSFEPSLSAYIPVKICDPFYLGKMLFSFKMRIWKSSSSSSHGTQSPTLPTIEPQSGHRSPHISSTSSFTSSSSNSSRSLSSAKSATITTSSSLSPPNPMSKTSQCACGDEDSRPIRCFPTKSSYKSRKNVRVMEGNDWVKGHLVGNVGPIKGPTVLIWQHCVFKFAKCSHSVYFVVCSIAS